MFQYFSSFFYSWRTERPMESFAQPQRTSFQILRRIIPWIPRTIAKMFLKQWSWISIPTIFAFQCPVVRIITIKILRVSRVWGCKVWREVFLLGLLFLLHPAFPLRLVAFSPGLRRLKAVKLIARPSSAAIGYNNRSLIWINLSPTLILVRFLNILNTRKYRFMIV